MSLLAIASISLAVGWISGFHVCWLQLIDGASIAAKLARAAKTMDERRKFIGDDPSFVSSYHAEYVKGGRSYDLTLVARPKAAALTKAVEGRE